MTELRKVTIAGAGVTGLTLAAELVDRGVKVRIADPAGAPGPHGCSWWAGGMLAPECEGESADPAVRRLGRQAADWWERQGAEVTRGGTLVVALNRDAGELERFARRVERGRMLDAEALGHLEPDLAGRFERGVLIESEAHLDPRAALGVLHARLEARGVTVERRDPMVESSAGTLIDARGLAASAALPDLRGVRGEMAILRSGDLRLGRPVRLLHPRYPLYVVPRGQGRFMIGATQIESSQRRHPRVRSVLELLSAAYALHPALAEADLLEIGSDARPAFPDNLPRIRKKGGHIHVNGLFRHGFLLSPSMAMMTADLICNDIEPEVMDEDHG
ncbi:FAD-dependent oxidoreductase [Profundibacterium mesophilum]|uniref:D-amino-acid oxidase n=1 Tax=Profundibacterium mesophilum KAUST100406-0324 TaxID=1037889 RepID=A0A921NRR7_9RHOB|nr:FAD-dependent oxidoreductase [Profundibacterium mesophilum]KAF0675154.1 Thiamine biosynthesis oxidoreductase [Profundibacterium mesophilum KAUST100406-0324]